MRWDQICLRVMLWSLAMAACMGVAAIFTSGSETMWRLLGTAMTTAVAAGLMWPLTRLAASPPTRVAGLFGMAAILLEFFLMLVLIWGQIFLRDSSFGFEEYLLWVFLFVFLTGLPALVVLLFWHHPAGWLAARVGAAAAALAFFELMIGTTHLRRGFFSSPDEEWVTAACATGLFGFLIVSCLVGTIKERPWRWAGLLASCVGWLMYTTHSFHPTKTHYGEIIFIVATTLAAVIAYANLCMLPRLALLHEFIRLGTIGVAIVTAFLIDAFFYQEIFYGGDDAGLMRLASAGGIVTACGTVAILILALVHKSHAPKAFAAISWLEMVITCPACGQEQKVKLGESVCAKCQLPFFIRIGERKRI
jgi:hypothetical protein